MNDITYFAKTNFRNEGKVFGIRQADRLMHMYIIGKTGTGKSTLLMTMFMQDIYSGRGGCLIDPHGDLAEALIKMIPESRKCDVVYFDIPDPELNLRYNPFKRVQYEKRSLVASGIIEVFKKLWHENWGNKLEHILRFAILTLLDQPAANVADIHKLLLDRNFRKNAMTHIQNESVKDFWQKEFINYNMYDLLPVLNKIGGMLAHPVIKRVLIENGEEVYLRRLMDEEKIIIVNLAKGQIGEDASHILGALFVSSINAAAFSRADIADESRKPFMLYLDEFHNFTTLSLVNMFSELRKFKVGLILAHQYIYQLDHEICKSILGNAGSIISFRIGVDDAQVISKEMASIFQIDDFINLPNYCIYLKLMVQGIPSKPFSAISLNQSSIIDTTSL